MPLLTAEERARIAAYIRSESRSSAALRAERDELLTLLEKSQEQAGAELLARGRSIVPWDIWWVRRPCCWSCDMQIEILIKIAGLGLLVSVIMNLLKQSGREELAALVAVVGLAIGTLLVLETVNSLMETIRRAFSLY